MEKKFWWFSKKEESEADFDEINNDYYGEGMSAHASGSSDNAYDSYEGEGSGDVSVVLSGDPSKNEPLMKRTFTPLTCEDSTEIVDAFKDGRVAVICVEELDKPNFLRLFDYLMGAVHALDGELKRLDRDTVVLIPYGADEELSVDDLEEELPDGEAEDSEDEDDGDGDDDGDID